MAEVFDSKTDRKRAHPTQVRVIEYTVEDGRAPTGPYRLLTTILDPDQAPAAELAGAYSHRREIGTAFDELKTHQRRSRAVLRSKSPDLVLQEIYGHLCYHYAIRNKVEAAEHAGRDPDRVSFTAALRIARPSTTQQGAFPPQTRDGIGRLWAHTIPELTRRILPKRRPRSNPRVVKRKYTRWHVKRACHRYWPQADRRPEQAVVP